MLSFTKRPQPRYYKFFFFFFLHMIVQFYCFQICLDSFIAWTGGRPAGFSCDMEISYLISFSDVGCSLHVLGLLHLFRVCFFVRAHLMSHIMFDELHREREPASHTFRKEKKESFLSYNRHQLRLCIWCLLLRGVHLKIIFCSVHYTSIIFIFFKI